MAEARAATPDILWQEPTRSGGRAQQSGGAGTLRAAVASGAGAPAGASTQFELSAARRPRRQHEPGAYRREPPGRHSAAAQQLFTESGSRSTAAVSLSPVAHTLSEYVRNQSHR